MRRRVRVRAHESAWRGATITKGVDDVGAHQGAKDVRGDRAARGRRTPGGARRHERRSALDGNALERVTADDLRDRRRGRDADGLPRRLDRDAADLLRGCVASLRRGRRRLCGSRRPDDADLRSHHGRHRLHAALCRHRHQRRGDGERRVAADCGGHGADGAREHRRPRGHRVGRGGLDADDDDRHVDRHGDHVRVPVGAVRCRRRAPRRLGLPVDPGSDELELHARRRRHRATSSRAGDRVERRRIRRRGIESHVAGDTVDDDRPAAQHDRAVDQRNHDGRTVSPGFRRHLGRRHAVDVRVPMGSVRCRRRLRRRLELHDDPQRDSVELYDDERRRGAQAADRRHRDEQPRRADGGLECDRRGSGLVHHGADRAGAAQHIPSVDHRVARGRGNAHGDLGHVDRHRAAHLLVPVAPLRRRRRRSRRR